MVRNSFFSIVLLISGLFFPAHLLFADLDTDKAHRLIQKGYEGFKNKNYPAAIQYFTESYRIVKHPLRLQNIARCHEMMKQYDPAILFYIEYALRIDRKPEITDTHQKILALIPFYASSPAVISLEKLQDLMNQLTRKGRLNEIPAVFIIAGLTSYKMKLCQEALLYLEKGVTAPAVKNSKTVNSITLLAIRICKNRIASLKSPDQSKPSLTKEDELPLFPAGS